VRRGGCLLPDLLSGSLDLVTPPIERVVLVVEYGYLLLGSGGQPLFGIETTVENRMPLTRRAEDDVQSLAGRQGRGFFVGNANRFLPSATRTTWTDLTIIVYCPPPPPFARVYIADPIRDESANPPRTDLLQTSSSSA
jgi:hypothetical protein